MQSRVLSKIYIIIIFSMVICLLLENIEGNARCADIETFCVDTDQFRAMQLSGIDLDYVDRCAVEWNVGRASLLTVLIMHDLPFNENDSFSYQQFVKKYNYLVRVYGQQYQETKAVIEAVFNDLAYFPVPRSQLHKEWVQYVDSWGFERTYGGSRRHEGTDIMADINVSGLYPVLSVTSGVVEKKGWLEKGGWRIGIRGESGGYFYYAHLAQYADLEVGDHVQAGQLIGFMGDTGYGVTEGTSGIFDVHLHFGIYIDYHGEELSINPYRLLLYLEKNILQYAY